jgi:hypothetical protein
MTAEPTTTQSPPPSPHFQTLAASRRAWIQDVLRPWCHSASVQDLRRAELEWHDLAGRADTAATLWTWAWERFPDAVHPDLPGLNETWPLEVHLHDGRILHGYPDARKSTRGQLILVQLEPPNPAQSPENNPISIDQIQSLRRSSPVPQAPVN